MGIKRYTANRDNVITNGYDYTLTTRGTGSNMGYADSLEVYSIYGQASSSATGRSQELARTLVQFPITDIITDRTAEQVPASGSVSFYLRMFNVETAFTLPQNFTLNITAISRSWAEGTGLDMEEYTDIGTSNWAKADSTTSWTKVGGDYHTHSADYRYDVSFPNGYEDLEVDISDIVEEWIAGTKTNYGFGVRLTSSQEAYYSASSGLDNGSIIFNPNGSTNTYFTKRFSARSSQYFFKRPVIEARWDSRKTDDRENFFYSSSVASATDNANTLYFYNYVRGRLRNLPGIATGLVQLSLYSGSSAPTGSKLLFSDGDFNVTGGYISTGIYTASVTVTAAATPLQTLFDVWHNGASTPKQYFTGSIYPSKMPTFDGAPTFQRVTACKNLKKKYSRKDNSRFRFFVRDKNWSPTLYTIATANNPTEIVESASYEVVRIADNFKAIPYGTGSNYHTYLSYDVSGNYFDLDMSLLEAGYMYEIKLSYYNGSIGDWIEQPHTFKFRVEE